MRVKISPLLVGLFILGAAALSIVGLVSFGSLEFLRDKQEFVILFDESVSGLTPGSAVKMRGVDVGEVTSLDVACNLKTQKSLVIARCKVDLDALSDHRGRSFEAKEKDVLRGLLGKGLRASLNFSGITGLLFVELDFYDLEAPSAEKLEDWELVAEDAIVVPSVPSTFTQFTHAVSEVLSELEQADFARIGIRVESLLETLDRQLGDVDLHELAESFSKAADAFAEVAGSPEVNGLLRSIGETVSEVRSFLETVDDRTGPVADEVRKTLEQARESLVSFQETTRSIERFFGPGERVGEQASRALEEMADAAAAVRRLADYLERNPGALISGRKRPESR